MSNVKLEIKGQAQGQKVYQFELVEENGNICVMVSNNNIITVYAVAAIFRPDLTIDLPPNCWFLPGKVDGKQLLTEAPEYTKIEQKLAKVREMVEVIRSGSVVSSFVNAECSHLLNIIDG